MHFVTFLSLVLAANAAVLPSLKPRALPPGCEEAYEEIELVEFNDGPSSSGEAGIGAEFETLDIQFGNRECSLEDTFKAKRKTIKGRSGNNFVLSADTSVEMGKGTLSAEYVLDGRAIKVGDGSAAAAGKAVRESLNSWSPWSEDPANKVVLEDYDDVSDDCKKPWDVLKLKESTKKDDIWWAPQVTAPLPLEALYSLMKENVIAGNDEGKRNILNGFILTPRGQNLNLVTKEYFSALSLKIDIGKVNDAVLGFCTLVLGYAKAANKHIDQNDPNVIEKSPKSWLTFMPRTEFVTIYDQVKSAFPPPGELFEIFNTLACYKTKVEAEGFVASIDTDYCKGTVEDPEPSDKFGKLEYKYIGQFPSKDAIQSFKIKEWIEKIDSGEAKPDLLTQLDKNYDGSIGGLDTAVEKMFETARTAPLFEFRDLYPVNTSGFEDFMTKVDASIQKLHKDFRDRSMIRVKRDGVKACDIAPNTEAPNPPEPPKPNFAPGTCGFHLRQEWSRAIETINTSSDIQIDRFLDNDKNEIGKLDRKNIHAEENVDVTSKLPLVLVVTPHDTGEGGEHEDRLDFTFNYGATSWRSDQSEGDAHCTVGDSDHPNWFMFGRVTQDMDCVFPCPGP